MKQSYVLNYTKEKCGICNSENTMVTDGQYICWDCGYNSPYSWNK